MTRKKTCYFIPGKNETVTKSKVKRLSRNQQIEIMRYWFGSEYDSPYELPYDSGEGGYQWIWGGPYDAEEEL